MRAAEIPADLRARFNQGAGGRAHSDEGRALTLLAELLGMWGDRVRAEVAEEIATVLDRCAAQAGNVMPFTADAYQAAAAIAREHAGSSPG